MAKALLEENARSLGCSPGLTNIERELREFPQPFTPPRGLLLIALQDSETAGVVRGEGVVGRRARCPGYQIIRLTPLP